MKKQFKQQKELQYRDKKLSKIITRIQSKPSKHFTVHNELLFSIEKCDIYRVMIPDEIREQLIKETHEHFGHVGAFKTYNVLKSNYQLNNMYRVIKKFTRPCELCQKSKVNTQWAREPTLSPEPTEPRDTVSLDLMGPLPRGQLGMKYILALVDTSSKYIKIYALKKATTHAILN